MATRYQILFAAPTKSLLPRTRDAPKKDKETVYPLWDTPINPLMIFPG